jgi:uncharacterized protein (TIGR03000 family)
MTKQRRYWLAWGTLVIAGALWGVRPGPAHGGGHGGGSHGGGRGSVGHGGSFHSGSHGGFHSNLIGTGWYGGYGTGWNYGRYGWRYPSRFRYGRGGYWPSLYSSGYSGGWGNWPFDSGFDSPDSGPEYVGSPAYPGAGQSYSRGYPPFDPEQIAPAYAAQLIVRVPPMAQVWVDGKVSNQQGGQRAFETSRLDLGRDHTYTVRACWEENGTKVERNQSVLVPAGGRATLIFLGPTSASAPGQSEK